MLIELNQGFAKDISDSSGMRRVRISFGVAAHVEIKVYSAYLSRLV